MKRAILRLPEDTRFESLTEEQQAAIQSVFAQFVLPMPGTVPADGWELVDGVAQDNFDPTVMPDLGMDWPIVGLWQWDGVGDLVTLVPLNGEIMLQHLPDTHDYDDEGNVIATYAPTLHIPSQWSGWPVPEI